MRFRIILFLLLLACVSHAQWENKVIEQVTSDSIWNDFVRHPFHMDYQGKSFVGYTEQRISDTRAFFKSNDPGGTWSQPFELQPDSNIGFVDDFTMTVNSQNGDVWFAHSGAVAFQGASVWVYRFRGDTVTSWNIDTKYAIWNGKGMDMVSDQEGNIHLVWYTIYWDSVSQEDRKYPIYAVYYNDVWHKQVLGDTNIYLGGDPQPLYLTISPAGRAYISRQYDLRRNDTLGGTNWEMLNWINLLHPYNLVGGFQVDKFDRVHLLESGYDVDFCAPKHYLYYYIRDDSTGAWSDSVILTDGGYPFSMFVDSLGDPHVAWSTWYDCFTDGNVIYTNNKSGQWISSVLIGGDSSAVETFDFLIDAEGRGSGAFVGFSDFINLYTDIYHIYSNPLDVTDPDPELPTQFQVLNGFPNPFNSRVTIEYYLERTGPVKIKIYNLLGQCVKYLYSGRISSPGTYRVFWDGKNDKGDLLASGTYFAELEANYVRSSKKLVLIR